jgi:hypothetical protein
VVDAGLEVGGVEVDVGEAGVVQGSVAEGGEAFVEVAADPGDLALGDAGVRTEGFDQVVDAAGGDAMDVCLDDDGVEGLVDAAPAFQQAGEEGAGAELGDGEFQVAGLGGQGPFAVAVAVSGAGVGVLAPCGTDVLCRLGFYQRAVSNVLPVSRL